MSKLLQLFKTTQFVLIKRTGLDQSRSLCSFISTDRQIRKKAPFEDFRLFQFDA